MGRCPCRQAHLLRLVLHHRHPLPMPLLWLPELEHLLVWAWSWLGLSFDRVQYRLLGLCARSSMRT